MLDDVFELFVQSQRSLDHSDGGLGVGLTLVRGLVERHGGTVSAQSSGEGKGCEFVVRLPVSQRRPASARPQFQASVGEPKHPLRLVIVEDNEDSRTMLCELLEMSGFDCKTASDGARGLDLISEVRPDVALIDTGLPELDGLEVAQRLRQDPKNADMHLIALTGYGQREDRDAVRRAGFDAHLIKPVDFDTLISLLRSHAKALAEAKKAQAT